jgi:hypothetical protein
VSESAALAKLAIMGKTMKNDWFEGSLIIFKQTHLDMAELP